jgi:hypothetical protein
MLHANLGRPNQRIKTTAINLAVSMLVVSRCAHPTIAS